MSSLQLFHKPFGIKNYINTCVEFFNPPIPLKSFETGEEYLDVSDLFQQSPRESEFEPFFIPPVGDVTICDLDTDNFEIIPDTDQIVSGKDFLKFQLLTINIETLIQIPTRVDFSLSEEVIGSLLKATLDPSIEVDEWGYPKDEKLWPTWLNHTDNMFNVHKPKEADHISFWEKDFKAGMQFLDEFRKSQTDLLLDPLVDAILDDDWGINNHLETKIEDLPAVSASYAEWDCPLMLMYSGKFWPQYTGAGWPNFTSPSYKIYEAFVRNNDEGSPI